MQITTPQITHREGETRCRFSVTSSWAPDTLWFAVDSEFEGLLSERSDSALLALLIPAMERDEDIHIAGTVSERLYYSLSRPYQAFLKAVIPSLSSIEIHANSVQPTQGQASGVATGFSAGIDSFAVLADYYYNDDRADSTITHLLYNNVGSHGDGGEQLFRERYERLQRTIEKIGLPSVAVNSNMDAFYDGFTFQKTHTVRNTAVALLLQGGIGTFLYGSTFDYEEICVKPTYDMAYTDPVGLPLLSTDGIETRDVGCEYTRVEKTLIVSDIVDSHESLDICARPDSASNCSDCWKCRRTLLTLEIAGLLDRYTEVFDLRAYRDGREQYMAEVLASDDPLLEEIVTFAEEQNFEFPARARVLARGKVGPANKLRSVVESAASNPTLQGVVKSNQTLRRAAKKSVRALGDTT
ncbi:hypothetical protein [Saliphagus infecundisoli]|uniref:Uncharacterized protein n=1 Tax=Saliphagus infecundisoli TaxID=1849069 RepID=A0ABD5QE19_9EURY|nr:hypothetical protein [Saliphagus infecundisoli]